jgi:hypothetical protein
LYFKLFDGAPPDNEEGNHAVPKPLSQSDESTCPTKGTKSFLSRAPCAESIRSRCGPNDELVLTFECEGFHRGSQGEVAVIPAESLQLVHHFLVLRHNNLISMPYCISIRPNIIPSSPHSNPLAKSSFSISSIFYQLFTIWFYMQ